MSTAARQLNHRSSAAPTIRDREDPPLRNPTERLVAAAPMALSLVVGTGLGLLAGGAAPVDGVGGADIAGLAGGGFGAALGTVVGSFVGFARQDGAADRRSPTTPAAIAVPPIAERSRTTPKPTPTGRFLPASGRAVRPRTSSELAAAWLAAPDRPAAVAAGRARRS